MHILSLTEPPLCFIMYHEKINGDDNMLIISLKELPHDAQHEYAHRLLRECLRLCGIDYGENTRITLGEHGKPSLADYPDIHYNVTHADGITACLVSSRECGIDAEKVRPYRPNVIKRAFSENEKALIENAPEAERDLLFFRLWTLKESYVKALGIGVSYPMNTAEFSFDGDEIVSNIDGYSFKQYVIDGQFAIAVCKKIKIS